MHKIKTATDNLCERDRQDLGTLNDMSAVLQQIFNDEQTLPEGLLVLAKLANNISFCDTDGKCVRNKCGNIDRSKQNTVFPGGIEFVQIASLRDADLSQLYDLSESYESALREDLRTIHNKIHFLCTQAESCAKDERLSQSLELPTTYPFFSDDKCASTLIQIANFLYLPVLTDELMRLVKELGSKDLDFDKKGDRYYFGRILVAAGEMCHEMLSLSICKHSELFSLLNTIRTRLCHNHTIMQDACSADKKLRFMSILKLFNTVLSKVMPNIKNEIKSFKALHKQAIACGDYESALQNILANIDALSDTLLHEQHMPTLAELSDIVEIDFPAQKQIKAAQSSILTKILDRFVEVVNAIAQINTLLEKKQKHPHLVINHINDITDKKISAIAAHIEQTENGGTEKWRKRITTPLRQYLHRITNTKQARATRTTFNYWVTVLNSRAPASMTLTGLNDDGSNLDEVKARIDDIKKTKGMAEFEKIFTIPSDKSPSKVHDLLRLVQEEIQFLLSTLSSIENDDEAIDEKSAGIFMFCQMKIGQFLRDLHLEKIDKTDPFKAVIAHAPLLGDAIAKTIQSRNKGLAHEVLRFNEKSFFKTLIHQTIPLEKTIAAILFLKDFAKPSLVVDGQMYLNPFLNIYVSYADAWIYLGHNGEARPHLQTALDEVEKLRLASDLTPDNEQALTKAELLLYNEILNIEIFQKTYSKNPSAFVLIFNEIKKRIHSLAPSIELAKIQLNISNLCLYIESYHEALAWSQMCLVHTETTSPQPDDPLLNEKKLYLQQSALIVQANAFRNLKNMSEAESALLKVAFDSIESKITQFDYLLQKSFLTFENKQYHESIQLQKAARSLLISAEGYFKSSYSEQVFLLKKIECINQAIRLLDLQVSWRAILNPTYETTSVADYAMQKIYIEEVCTLIAEVSWIHDKGKSCNIVVHQDHAHLLAENAWFFINEFIARNMLYIDQHKLHMLSLVENLLHLSTIYSYAVPLAELYFCQAICYTNDPKKTVEEKLLVLDSAIATAEAHLTMRKRDVGQQLQVRPTVPPEQLIKDTIKKMWTLYRQRFGNPVGTVRMFSSLKDIVISSLQTDSKTTFTTLQKIAAISAEVEMLEYHMDLGVANRDPETVELIQKNGGTIKGVDQAEQTLRFSMLPEKLTSTLQERLGLEKISITNTSTRVSVWIGKIQRMFTGITVGANCVVTDAAPYVAADYFLTYRQPLQKKVNQALQEQHVPNRQSLSCTPVI